MHWIDLKTQIDSKGRNHTQPTKTQIKGKKGVLLFFGTTLVDKLSKLFVENNKLKDSINKPEDGKSQS